MAGKKEKTSSQTAEHRRYNLFSGINADVFLAHVGMLLLTVLCSMLVIVHAKVYIVERKFFYRTLVFCVLQLMMYLVCFINSFGQLGYLFVDWSTAAVLTCLPSFFVYLGAFVVYTTVPQFWNLEYGPK